MQHKSRVDVRLHLRERVVELLEPPPRVQLRNRVSLDCALQIYDHIDRSYGLGRGCKAQCVLMQNVSGHGHHIRFWISDRLMAIDPKKAQKNLLDEIGHICSVAQARRQIATQLAAMLGRDLRYKRLFPVSLQWDPLKHFELVSLERLAVNNGYLYGSEC